MTDGRTDGRTDRQTDGRRRLQYPVGIIMGNIQICQIQVTSEKHDHIASVKMRKANIQTAYTFK